MKKCPYYDFEFLGTYQSPDGVQEVAIKIPKITWNTGCSPKEVENLKSFYAEAQITIGFDHDNVLSCLGISTGLINLVKITIITQTFLLKATFYYSIIS